MTESAADEALRRFPKDTAEHQLTIIKSDGLYRHLRCRKPGTGAMGFDVVTWPWYLAYTGDMGEFLFSRLPDMFEFFRARKDATTKQRINPGYWAEKCEAAKPDGKGIQEFSVEKFRENVLDYARSHLGLDDEEELPRDAKEELRALLTADDEYECVSAIRDFDSDKFSFQDFWEHDNTAWTFRYIWCCQALVWAIDKFDEATKAEAAT